MTAMLNVKDLRAYYGQVQALHGLNFSLNEGSLTTLLGANGAGKTTTLRAICNMVRSTGAIEFNGAPLGQPLHRKRRPPWDRACAAGPWHLHQHDRGREPAARRHHARRQEGHRCRHRADVRPLPGAEATQHPASRHAVRRRAADARGGPRTDAASATDAAGRTVVRPGAADRARPVPYPRQDQPRGQGHDPGGRAERATRRWSLPTRPT